MEEQHLELGVQLAKEQAKTEGKSSMIYALFPMLIGLNTLIVAITGLGFIVGWKEQQHYILGVILLALGLISFGLLFKRRITCMK